MRSVDDSLVHITRDSGSKKLEAAFEFVSGLIDCPARYPPEPPEAAPQIVPDQRHPSCSTGVDSWCQSAKTTGTTSRRHGSARPYGSCSTPYPNGTLEACPRSC